MSLARYTGSKVNASALVNAALGKVDRWYEPFGGMLSLYLRYPHRPKEVVLGDINCLAVNLWRTVAYGSFEEFEPHTLAPWSHVDLKAWASLMRSMSAGLRAELEADPRHYHAELAGRYWWWCHGRIERSMDLESTSTPRGRCDGGRPAQEAFESFAARLSGAMLLQSSWDLVVSDSRLGVASMVANKRTGAHGIIVDPPYDGFDLYCRPVDLGEVEARARELGRYDWCRVIYFGYEADMPGWARVGFKTKNAARKTTGFDGAWLSPACLTTEQLPLFAEAA